MPTMTRIDLRGRTDSPRELAASLPRVSVNLAESIPMVQPLIEQVRAGGVTAVKKLTARFDGVELESVRVPAQAYENVQPSVREALEESIRRVRLVAEAGMPQDTVVNVAETTRVTTRWLPVQRVGLYVPGGLAAYPSSVVMNVVPAQVAGVPSIALASPPAPDGLPHYVVRAAAYLLGVEEVWSMGGAQAIAAFAYGWDSDVAAGTHGQTEDSLKPVNVITGPGNKFVAAAKACVQTDCGIDTIAGPTEILIVADESASPEFIAADLISQAEHDPQAAAVLVSTSESLLDAVQAEIDSQCEVATHAERIATALTGKQSSLIVVGDLREALQVANFYAGEHVELLVKDPEEFAAGLHAGGSIFLGPYAPVALGDYCSGANHVLPTSGTAAFASVLGVHSFLKASQVISADADGLAAVSGYIHTLSQVENLPAHGIAATIRGSQKRPWYSARAEEH